MNILIIDNYDSFTYNLYHLIEAVMPTEYALKVKRNDEISINEIKKFDKIVLSPGPGLPQSAGITKDVIQTYSTSKSFFGVCLGHQAIAEVFGAKLINLNEVLHGVAIETYTTENHDLIFNSCPPKFETARYHSWVVDDSDFPDCLEVTARDKLGYIMALKHRNLDLRGVQFHPESILTPCGRKMLENWILAPTP